MVTEGLDADRGPVLVTIEYRIDLRRESEFLAAIQIMRRIREREVRFSGKCFRMRPIPRATPNAS